MSAREKAGLLLFIFGVGILLKYMDGNTVAQGMAYFAGLVSAAIGAMVFAYEEDKQP